MSALDTQPFPRGALIAVGLLVGLSVASTAAVRLARLHEPPARWATTPADPVTSEDLRFSDGPDGSVSVRDSGTGALVATLAPGSGGFVRGVMRGLVHDRKVRGIGTEAPFRLSELQDRELWLEDTATGRVIDLQAFGSTNRDAFFHLLHPQAAPS
jgi:putative photosynthetic complex assembly protein